MSEFKQITNGEEFLNAYWEGPSNRFVRYWTYLRRGMGLFNEWKNYILVVFGTFLTYFFSGRLIEVFNLRLSPFWILGAAVVGIGALLWLGHWDLYRASKPIEYINAQNGTITGYNQYNMTIQQLEILEEVRELLKEIVARNTNPTKTNI